MARSVRYRELQRNVSELRRHLLPREFDPTGSYTDRTLTRALAFRVLAHAELESFLEDVAWDRARRALVDWKSSREVGRTALALVAFSGFLHEAPPASLEPDQPADKKVWPGKLELGEKLQRAANAYHHVVESNHGIREKNLLALLLPVGITPGDLDPVHVATLDSFGQKRGEAAHSSVISYRTKQPPDPESELKEVTDIVAWLKGIDSLMQA